MTNICLKLFVFLVSVSSPRWSTSFCINSFIFAK